MSTKFNNHQLQETKSFIQNHPFLFKPPNSNMLITVDEVELATTKLRNTIAGSRGISNII